MFTGIIRELGKIEFYQMHGETLRLGISTQLPAERLHIGASVACNGCCLTITHIEDQNLKKIFYVDIGPQTLQTTRFALFQVGDFVNLEPSLRMGDPIDGHQVSGHIDTLCKIHSLHKIDGNFWNLSLDVEKKYAHWIIPKGSLSVAGISLTIAEVIRSQDGNKIITIMIIPHTFCNTILHFLKTGMQVEVEFDQNVKAIASVIQSMVPSYI